MMEKGRALGILMEEIQSTIVKAQTSTTLKDFGIKLDAELKRIQVVLKHLSQFGATDVDRFLSDATVFMEQLSYVVIGWQWLKMGSVAARRLETGDFSKQTKDFYEGKVHAMKFYFRYELPHAAACAETMMDGEYLTNLKNWKVF